MEDYTPGKPWGTIRFRHQEPRCWHRNAFSSASRPRLSLRTERCCSSPTSEATTRLVLTCRTRLAASTRSLEQSQDGMFNRLLLSPDLRWVDRMREEPMVSFGRKAWGEWAQSTRASSFFMGRPEYRSPRCSLAMAGSPSSQKTTLEPTTWCLWFLVRFRPVLAMSQNGHRTPPSNVLRAKKVAFNCEICSTKR